MVAGPNGSGKSTLIEALRSNPDIQLPPTYINADDLKRQHRLDATAAQRTATELRARALAERRDFMYETVMSHPSKLAELQAARIAGYRITVHFVATDDADVNVQRVAMRVAAGGHDVPVDRIRERYVRTMRLAPAALTLADDALLFDNTMRGAEGGLSLQGRLVESRLQLQTARPAAWAARLSAEMSERAAELKKLHDGNRTGAPMESALLNGGVTEGVIEHAGLHYVVQRVDRSRVIHDRALIVGRDLKLNQAYRLGYLAGMAKVEGLPRER
jgi:predicted ABC-type ATPase